MHYSGCETKQLLLRSHVCHYVNITDKNRTFPTEIDRNFIWLGQILISLPLRVLQTFLNIRLTGPEALMTSSESS